VVSSKSLDQKGVSSEWHEGGSEGVERGHGVVVSGDEEARTVGGKQGHLIYRRLSSLVSRFALLGVWLVIVIIYGAIMPHRFLKISSIEAIFNSQATILFLAFASLSTFLVGEFDLSFAAVMGLSATVVAVLVSLHHVNIWLSCGIAVGVSVLAGVINAVFVVKFHVSSLVVTLGSSSVFLGLAELISSSNTVSISDAGFSKVSLYSVLGLPLSFYYGLLLAVVFGYVLYLTPLGRSIAFVGANREVARLAGIKVDLIRAGSYLVDALIAGLGGVLLISSVGGFDPTASANYLLPALAAVFLGTALVTPGQFNPVGTFLGIYFLETGVLGLELLGYSGWVENAFYGAGLIVAVTLSTVVRERVRFAVGSKH